MSMNGSTPRIAGLSLRVAETLARTTPLPRLLSSRVIERKLYAIDFAAEGEPAPYYMPPPYRSQRNDRNHKR
jgi:hypothetical protein